MKEPKKFNGQSIVLAGYSRYSKSAKATAKALGIARDRLDYLYDHALNWGKSSMGGFQVRKGWINDPRAVSICGNKLSFFRTVAETTRIPEYTSDKDEALKWVAEGKVVMGRSRRGSCGEDIAFFDEDAQEWDRSEFWVVYKKKKAEFRVHFIRIGDEFKAHLVQQKIARTTHPDTGETIDTTALDYRIRNHANGFIFKRHGLKVPTDVLKQAEVAARSIERLDFGAVDVIYNQYEDKAYVLEINTAPGLEESSIDDYSKAMLELIEFKTSKVAAAAA